MHDIDIENMTDEAFLDFVEKLENEEEVLETESVLDEDILNDEPENAPETDKTEADTDLASPEESKDTGYDKGLADGRNARLMSHIKKLYPDLTEEDAVDRFLEAADREAAEAEGLPYEEYINQRQEREEFDRFKAEREKKRQDEEALNAIVEKWQADTERMKNIIPGFDFEKAMEQSQFRDKVINEGKDIISAYFELNPINKPPEASARRDIEVGDMPGGVSGFKSPLDIEKASEEEFREYLRKKLEDE